MSDNIPNNNEIIPSNLEEAYGPEVVAHDPENWDVLKTHTRNVVKAEIIYHDKRYGSEWDKLSYATPGSAGLDMRASLDAPLVLNPGECVLIKTGVAIFLNDANFMLNLHPRSGLGFKHGIVLGNLTGIVDSDYQNEIGIPAWNRSSEAYTIQPGDRIAQLITVPIYHLDLNEVESFSQETERGLGGFGHSGKA